MLSTRKFEDLMNDVLIGLVAVFLTVIGVAAIISCGGTAHEQNQTEVSEISEGIVVDKRYSEPCTTETQVQSGRETIYELHHTPASYCMKIRGEKDEVTVECWLVCTEQEYDAYSIGDYYIKEH